MGIQNGAFTGRGPRLRFLVISSLLVLVLSYFFQLSPAAQADGNKEIPGTGTLSFTDIKGRIGVSVINDSGTDRKTEVYDTAYSGIIRGKEPFNSTDPNEYSSRHRRGVEPRWLTPEVAQNDYWSYFSRGIPYYDQRDRGVISVSDTSALGYKPNDPGTVKANTPFLIGTVRHNNFPIMSYVHWVHSSFDIQIGDFKESFPFDQFETDNDTQTTAVSRRGGPYVFDSVQRRGYSCPWSARYHAYSRGGGINCYRYVGEGNGDRDIYTNYPANYPESAGVPDQTPDSDDILTITKTTSSMSVQIDGMSYRLVLFGFVPSVDGNCPAVVPEGTQRVNVFKTKENQSSFGCLYGSFSQERYVRIAKTVTGDPSVQGSNIPAFSFTTVGYGDWTGSIDATPRKDIVPNVSSFIDWGSFSAEPLTPSGFGARGTVYSSEYYAFTVGNSQFVIAEGGPILPGRPAPNFGQPGFKGPWKVGEGGAQGRWEKTSVKCLNGLGEEVQATIDADSGGIDFGQVQAARSPQAVPITCTFVNEYTQPKISVQKTLVDNGGMSVGDDFTVTFAIQAKNEGTLPGLTGPLRDTPGFASGLEITSARVAASFDELDTASAATLDEGSYLLTEGVELAPGKTATFYIRFNVHRNPGASGYSEQNLECERDAEGTWVRGRGLWNQVSTDPGYDADGEKNNIDCGPARLRPIRVTKVGTQAQGAVNPDGSYPLPGAEFAIYDADPATATSALTPVSVLSDPTGLKSEFESSPLEIGREYWLVETRAPAGHNLLARGVRFRLKIDDSSAGRPTVIELLDSVEQRGMSITVISSSDGLARQHPAIQVFDLEVGHLPYTGGSGILPYLLVGLLLLGSAGMMRMNRM